MLPDIDDLSSHPPIPTDALLPESAEMRDREGHHFRPEKLNAPEPGCMALTYGRFWFHWSMYRPNWLAIAARDGTGEVVGLALLSQPMTEDGRLIRRLLSLSVAGAHRGRGMGRELLLAAQEAARESGTQELFANYSDKMSSRPGFERVLAAAGWKAPEPVEYTIIGQAKWVQAASANWRLLFSRAARSGFSMTPWTGVTESDRSEIDAALRNGEAPQDWHPDLFLRAGSEPFSLLLRYRSKIIGWIIGEKDGSHCVHYRRGCLFPPYRRHGFLIAGLHEVCRRQAEILGENSVCVNWASAGSDMARFMETRLRPLLIEDITDPQQLAKANDARAHGYLTVRYMASRRLE